MKKKHCIYLVFPVLVACIVYLYVIDSYEPDPEQLDVGF